MKTYSSSQIISDQSPIIDILSKGGLVVAPTDTSYGILVDATSQVAIKKLFKLKDRRVGQAISVFVCDFEMMEQFVDTALIPPNTKDLLPGPYTFVLPSKGKVCKDLEAEDSTLGVRLVENDLITSIVKAFGRPLTATSANVSGKSSAYSVLAFINQLSKSRLELIDAVIDGGELPRNPPSTVVRLTGHSPEVLRSSTRNFLHHKPHVSMSPKDTQIIAKGVYEELSEVIGKKSIVILLDGELGSGKTTWTKYFAKHFGLSKIISPTYTYECEYKLSPTWSKAKLFRHFDLYNITHADDLSSMRLERMIGDSSINVIEWSAQMESNLLDELTKSTYLVQIRFVYITESSRKISVNYN